MLVRPTRETCMSHVWQHANDLLSTGPVPAGPAGRLPGGHLQQFTLLQDDQCQPSFVHMRTGRICRLYCGQAQSRVALLLCHAAIGRQAARFERGMSLADLQAASNALDD